jgi:hypothetical protein
MRTAGRYLRMECGGQLCFRMAEPVYGIDDFPDDDSLWRVEWIGMETRSGVHAFWSPGVRSGLASRTGMPSSLRLPSSLAINGVDVGVVHNDESRSAPADRTSWQELQRSCHGRFFAPDGGKTLPS